ncbi:MAG: hypothetical protein U0Q15_20745 [Kineosporiaceae bacterium]
MTPVPATAAGAAAPRQGAPSPGAATQLSDPGVQAAPPAGVATWDAAATAAAPSAVSAPAASVVPGGAALPVGHTPTRLRAASALAALAGIALALFGAWTLQARTTALHAAASDAAQLVRLQQIDTSLVSADAAVTNAFLVGGLEPAASRQAYDEAITSATGQIAQAAAAQPADAAALEALNQRVISYVALIEQARANNRQLLPVGSGYLSAGSAQLRSDVLPVVDVLVDTTQARIDGEFASAGRHTATLLALGVAVLALLVLLSVWHARRFRRVINVPLAVGTVAALLAVAAGTAALVVADGRADDVRSGVLAHALAISDARTAGFDAKAQESLGLVNRGRGPTFEKQWGAAAETVRTRTAGSGSASTELLADWDAYTSAHAAIRADDDNGAWERAVAKAVARGDGSANAAFESFAQRSGQALDEQASAAAEDLRAARAPLTWAAILVVVLGLLAAAGGVLGFAQRSREYQ